MSSIEENDGASFVRDDGEYQHSYTIPATTPGYESPNFKDPLVPAYMRDVKIHRIDAHGVHHLVGRSPNFDHLWQVTLDKLPRYLYRVTHKDSGGRSSQGKFQSASIVSGLGKTDISLFSTEDTQQSLASHLDGIVMLKGHRFDSPWISFTDSWLFVLWIALRHRAAKCTGSKIHILDTYTIKSPTFMAHSYSIVKAYKVGIDKAETFYKRMMGAAHTEFLVWNEIQTESTDEVELETILEADHDETVRILKSFNSRSENPRESGKITRKPPSKLRAMLYDDEQEMRWRKEDAYQGIKSMKWLNERVTSGRMRQARPPLYCKLKELHRGLDIQQFEAAIRIAKCFKAPFQLDVLIAHLSTLTKTIAFDSIIESLIRSNEVREMALGYTYYPACQKTNRPPEVKMHQQMFRTFAKHRGIQIVEGPNQALRDLIRIENSGHPSKPRMFNKLNKPYIGSGTGPRTASAVMNTRAYAQPGNDDLDTQLQELDASEFRENEVREATSPKSLEEVLLEELGADSDSDSEPPHKRSKIGSSATALQRPTMLKLNCPSR